MTSVRERPAPASADPVDRTRRRTTAVAFVAGTVAIVCALLLPFAPVAVNQPVVSWPLVAARPESTSLMLNAGKPLSIDLEFSVRALRQAAGSLDGVLLSTVRPSEPTAGAQGLLVRAAEGRVLIRSRGQVLYDQPLPVGDGAFQLRIDAAGAQLQQDGNRVALFTGSLLPAVDSLVTTVSTIPGASSKDLSVVVRVDDIFSSTPTPLKRLLVGLLLLTAAIAAGALVRMDGPRTGLWRRLRRLPRSLRVVDLLVPTVLVVWLFVAPGTDDDGYYSAMAGNVPSEGYVAQYYQLFNQAFTPFTWFYYLIAKWQELFGVSPVALRIPALLVGLATWTVIRVFAARQFGPSRLRPVLVQAVLAASFLAWWLPYAMGVRPEAAVGLLAAGTLLSVTIAIERSELRWAALGVALAGLAVTCHPTGFVALGPLIVGFRGILRVLRIGGGWRKPLVRIVAVLSAGAVASAAAFADGSFYDFVRSQQIFLAIQNQNDWRDEIQRYSFLLSNDPMGSYAKRVAVLVGLLVLAWFAVLSVAARVNKVELATRTTLAGWSLGLAFLLMWLTPSKWTHHFGALAGLGPVFLALFLVGLPDLVRSLSAGRKPPWGVWLVGATGVVLVLALAFNGPNVWAYNWLLGMPHANVAPFVWGVALNSPMWWTILLVSTVLVGRLLCRRMPSPAYTGGVLAMPVVITLAFVVSIVYLVGSFSLASARTLDTWSPGAANLRDPFARQCDASSTVWVGDIGAESELPVQSGVQAASAGFALGGGFYSPDPPPAPLNRTGGVSVWGSLQGDGLASSGIAGAEGTTGKVTTPWYSVPVTAKDSQIVVLAAGRLSGGNFLVAEYGSSTLNGAEVRRSVPLDDGVDTPVWRSFVINSSPGADVVRLVAQDGSTGIGAWLSFSAPAKAPLKTLQDYLPQDAPVGVAWQFAFLFPCQRKPVVGDGITERSDYGVVYGAGGISGVYDNTWLAGRGGLFGPILKSASVTRLPAGLRDFPLINSIQVFKFDYQYAKDAYLLTRSREKVSGFSGP